jgi:SAM-dependent methyltransferase
MQPEWTPADLLQLSGGYWGACALHAGVKMNIFTTVARETRTVEELATATGADSRGLAMLLDSLCALKLLVKRGDRYSATPFAAEYLSRDSEKYLGHIILHHHHLMESWARLDEGVRRGGPIAPRISHGDDETVRESFLMGMFNLAMQLAPRIVEAVDLSGRRRLLDLGGGPGTYAIHFCQKYPSIEAVIFDLATTREFAEKTVARFGLSERITFHPGDFITDDFPSGFDAAWLSHVLHSEGPDGCAVMLSKTVAALQPGGIVMIQEFILDDTLDGPVFPALFSLNMLLGTPAGQAYSGRQLSDMLQEAGAVEVKRLPVDLPNAAGIIVGTKPA